MRRRAGAARVAQPHTACWTRRGRRQGDAGDRRLSPTLVATMDEKAALRASTRKTLRALSALTISAASERACARAATLTASAAAVSVYLAMPRGECETGPLFQMLLAAGKRVFVPRVEGPDRGDMRMLQVADAATLEAFPRSKWGIPEPTDAQAAAMTDGLQDASVDMVIVPAVAFDRSCRRLGQGRGFYDTWLERLASAREAKGLPPAITVGLGLQEQLVERVPCEAHDVPLDYVCLPDVLLVRGDGDSA